MTLDHSKILVFLKDQSAACSGNVWSSVVDVNNGSEYVYYYVCQYIYIEPSVLPYNIYKLSGKSLFLLLQMAMDEVAHPDHRWCTKN